MEPIWNGETRTVTANNGDTIVVLPIGSKHATVRGDQIELDVPATIINGRTLVPARFIAESLGAQVSWNSETRTVLISTIGIEECINEQVNVNETLTPTEIGKKSNAVVFILNYDVEGNTSQGSGFAISSDGKILTNYHVIDKASELEITFDDGTQYYTDIKVLGYDKEKDIAILKIPANNIPYLELGNSDDIELGNDVVAIGSPEGLQNTLSTGVVSGIREGRIQITAPISHGSSGGALFNSYGQVIGITSSGIIEGENLGFAIPINEVNLLNINKNLSLAQLNRIENPIEIPTGVRAKAISSSQIKVGWNKIKNADYYYVYQSDLFNGPYNKICSDENNYKWYWYEDYCMETYDIQPNTTIYYKITAVINGIESDYSEIVYATTLPENKMTYEEFANYLYNTASGFHIDNDTHIIEFYRIGLSESISTDDSLCLFYFIDRENVLDLNEALKDGHEEDIRDLLFECICEIKEYYSGKNVIAYIVYADVFDTYPSVFEKNNILSDTIAYDEDTKNWNVWYPILEIISNKSQEGYTYQWVDNSQ